MIKISRATNEKRQRDKKHRRLLLIVGKQQWHMSRAEARVLRGQLNHFKL